MSYSFAGSTHRLTGSFSGTPHGEPATLAAYVKTTNHPAALSAIFQYGNNSANAQDSYAIYTTATDNQWGARSVDSGATANTSAHTLNVDNTWAALVAVFTADDTGGASVCRQIYVNGNTSDPQVLTRAVANALRYLSVGRALSGTQPFAGLIAEVAVWNIALNTTQIANYSSGSAASLIAPSNLLGYWSLAASGTTQANEGIDTGGDLTVVDATFSADHPTITGGGLAARRSPASLKAKNLGMEGLLIF